MRRMLAKRSPGSRLQLTLSEIRLLEDLIMLDMGCEQSRSEPETMALLRSASRTLMNQRKVYQNNGRFEVEA